MIPAVANGTPLPSHGLTADVVTTAAGLAVLREEWTALLHETTSPNPFLTWEWAHCWWTHFGGTASPHVIVIRQDTALIALMPLMRTKTRLRYASRLEFIGLGLAGADYVDAIVKPGHETESREALVHAIEEHRAALYLDHLAPESFAASLAEPLTQARWTAEFSHPDVCPYIDLSGYDTFETYLAGLGASHRANVRRRLRQLNVNFTLRFARMESIEESAAALERLIEFHRDRFGERSSAFAAPPARAFHRDLIKRAYDAGWLRMFTLSLNDEIAAVMYGFEMNGCFYFYQHGFRADYGAHGAGLVLMGLTIQAAIEAGLRQFDMLYGHEAYKFLWARQQRQLGRLQLFPPHLGGTLLRRQVKTRRALGGVARKLGLKKQPNEQS